MDPIQNPYSPGAGVPPPELAGRQAELDRFRVFVQRLVAAKVDQSMVITGLRGVGKTVLLNQFEKVARDAGAQSVFHEAAEDESFPRRLAVLLQELLQSLGFVEKLKAGAKAALQAVSDFKVEYEGVTVALDVKRADALDLRLTRLFLKCGEALSEHLTAGLIFIDEIQHLSATELGAVVAALHRCAQKGLPLSVAAAGLPLVHGRLGQAKSYAERLFTFPRIDRLDPADAAEALEKPAAELGVRYEAAATRRIIELSQGYPYFLQEYGKMVWNLAEGPSIGLQDVAKAEPVVLEQLDEGFFRVRTERVTDAEREYLAAMAHELRFGDEGARRPGDERAVRSGQIAMRLGKKVTSVAPTRSNLIAKGLIYSPQHGYTAFTVPQFDLYMSRNYPHEA